MTASSLQLYAMLFFAGDGTLLVEEHQIDIRRSAGAQRVFTVAKGLAGLSPGSPLFEFDVTSAIPSAGFEMDMGSKIAGLIPISAQIIFAGGAKSIKQKCFIEHDSIRHGVNQEAQYSFSGVGPLAMFT